jgi:ketosteroid isomerase-like protein
MKIRLFLTLAGVAFCFASLTFAQQKEPTLSEQDRQQLDALATKYADAVNKNDAAAIAALFTEDGKFVTPAGILSGREAIEKTYQSLFKGGHTSDMVIKSLDLHGAGNLAWAVGQWSDNTGRGNWGAVDQRDGDTWRIRMLTYNETPSTPRQELLALAKKFEEAWDNNDAVALAALFTKDAVLVNDSGPVYGREAIEKYYADLFKNVHFSNNVTTYNDSSCPHIMGTNGSEMWENGEWSMTWQVKGGDPVQGKGYHASIAVREDGVLKKRMLINNITPPPAK